MTDHFNLCFLATGRGGLPFRDFCDFCLFAFETDADMVGDFRGDRAGFDSRFLVIFGLRGLGLLRTGGVGGGPVGGGMLINFSSDTRVSILGFSSKRKAVPAESNASSASRISCCTLSERSSESLSTVGVLFRLGGVGGIIGIGVAMSSLSGWISRASSRSNVNFVGLGSDLTDFFLASVGRRGDGRGFSNGEPGGGDTLLAPYVFERIDPWPGEYPGLPLCGRCRGDAKPACCSQLHKELFEECGVSGRGGRCVIR